MQQYLPFTVLKPKIASNLSLASDSVATVLTVYGIETNKHPIVRCEQRVATVLTVYGIETAPSGQTYQLLSSVATVLTVYGIETCCSDVC